MNWFVSDVARLSKRYVKVEKSEILSIDRDKSMFAEKIETNCLLSFSRIFEVLCLDLSFAPPSTFTIVFPEQKKKTNWFT